MTVSSSKKIESSRASSEYLPGVLWLLNFHWPVSLEDLIFRKFGIKWQVDSMSDTGYWMISGELWNCICWLQGWTLEVTCQWMTGCIWIESLPGRSKVSCHGEVDALLKSGWVIPQWIHLKLYEMQVMHALICPSTQTWILWCPINTAMVNACLLLQHDSALNLTTWFF